MIPSGAINWLALQHRRLGALRGATIVVKVGGSIQDDPAQMRAVMRDVAALASLGARPVVIHGGGKAITAAMTKAGIASRFVQGQRYTDAATLAIVEDVLVGEVNRELVGYLEAEGVAAVGLHARGTCVLTAERAGTDAAPGRPAEDLGLVGRVTSVAAGEIRRAMERGGGGGGDGGGGVAAVEGLTVPVIAPVARDAAARPGEPGKLNVNADLAAGRVAAELRPALFVLVSDTPGVRTDMAKSDSYAASLSRAEVDRLIAAGVIAGGMLPKLTACFDALGAGEGAGASASAAGAAPPRVCIVDGRVDGSLLAAALAQPGEPIAGTWVGE